jgi:trehalose 2-sulfotransferase
VFPDLQFVRVVRANKVRQAVSLWKAVQTATWRQEDANSGGGVSDAGAPPYKSFLEDHRPRLRFHYGAIEHLLGQILAEEAHWDAFFEHARIKPVLVLYENFAADPQVSATRVLERLEVSPPDGFSFEPRMRPQSDELNDDWTRRYSEIRLGTEFDLVPVVPQPA